MKSLVGVYKFDYAKKEEDLIGHFDEQAFIGHSESADIIINDPKVSGIHALLERVNNEFYLIDLGSDWGTFKKNKRIKDIVITEGEPFQLGKQVIFLKNIYDKKLIKVLKQKNIKLENTEPVQLVKTEFTSSALSERKILQVTHYWGEKTLDVRSFAENSVITLGPQHEATFVVALDNTDMLNTSPMTIGRFENGLLTLNLPAEASGLVWMDGQVHSIDNLRPHDDNTKKLGELEIKLKIGEKAHVHFGELSFCFTFITPAKPIPINWFAELDSSIVKITLGIITLLLFLFIYIQLTPRPPEPVKTLDDIPPSLKRVLFDSGVKNAVNKERAAIGQLAQNLAGGRENGDEGKSAGTTMQQGANDNKNQISNLPQKERTIGISKNIGQIANKKAALDIDSVFATDTKAASVNTNNIPTKGSGQAGNVVSKLLGNNYGKGSKGTGTGGAGSSVSIGQLKGNSNGGAMGHGDAGLIPSKGLEINSNSDGNGGQDISVVGGLDSDIIASIIKRYLPQIQNCYEQQLVVNQGLSGKLTVAFTIGPDGSVKNQSVAESSLNNRPTENCILDKIHEWKFPRPRGGGTVGVKYPFLLMSSRSR